MTMMRVNSNLTKLGLPLITIALFFAIVSEAESFTQSSRSSRDEPRRTRVLATGRFTGSREIQQVVTWQTRGVTHLSIETAGSRPRVLWQMDGVSPESRVDSVRVSDLDADGVPEIVSLWWKGASPGAALRVFHWERSQNAFVELQCEDELNNVLGYRIQPDRGNRSNRSTNRLIVDMRSDAGGRRRNVPGGDYELRGSRLVRVGGGGVVTTQGESGIEGQAIISPTHPGPVRQGESDSAPYKTTLGVWRTSDDREVARVETGSDGRFRVALPPGEYRIGPLPRTGRFLPRASEETVSVVAGRFVRVTINFDSGMR